MNNIIQPENIEQAVSLLKKGDLVAIPTETVYGLAADIANEQAVMQIFALKNRPNTHPLIIHISDTKQLPQYAVNIPSYVEPLVRHFWPGPLTLVLYKSQLVGDWVTGGQDTVGIRMPKHPLALELIERTGTPLAAPSANRFGKISPTQVEHVTAEFGDSIHVLDGGHCEVGIESTIIDATEEGSCTVLRPGMISIEAIKAVLGSKITIQQPTQHSKKVSGTLESHYAPHKPTYLFNSIEELKAIKAEHSVSIYGLILSDKNATLCERGIKMSSTPTDYAHELYDALRKADNSDCEFIAIERPQGSLDWAAILDRLQRSCASTTLSIEEIN